MNVFCVLFNVFLDDVVRYICVGEISIWLQLEMIRNLISISCIINICLVVLKVEEERELEEYFQFYVRV